MTFGFVDRGGSSVELVWARYSALCRDWSSSGFGWTPSRLLPCLLPSLASRVKRRRGRCFASGPAVVPLVRRERFGASAWLAAKEFLADRLQELVDRAAEHLGLEAELG